MQNILEHALDDLTSPRSLSEKQSEALQTLEEALARSLQRKGHPEDGLETFLRLQESFQCNFVARSLPCLVHDINFLKSVTERKRDHLKEDEGEDFRPVADRVVRLLFLFQGLSLLHTPSKEFLGKRYSLEILLDVLSVSRQAILKPMPQNSTSEGVIKVEDQDHHIESSLASTVLDTFLCILVDSPTAIREFERANGLELVVKVLKRAAIPRLVRMKCLEFLYFYLMDERGENDAQQNRDRPSTSLDSSMRPRNVTLSSRVLTNTSTSESPSPSSSVPRIPVTPKKPSRPQQGPLGHLGMFRKEVDFVPMSPKKAQIQRLGIGKRDGDINPFSPSARRTRKVSPLSRALSEDPFDNEGHSHDISSTSRSNTRSIEQKKETLGQLLGNVDALVEGVKKAGIWDLRE